VAPVFFVTAYVQYQKKKKKKKKKEKEKNDSIGLCHEATSQQANTPTV
jgi:hypothetical protein